MTAPTVPEVGQDLFDVSFIVDRDRLVRYAAASGDFNPIHYNDAFATEVGLPGVIAHGMCTMGLAATAVTDWAGDPGAVVDMQARFSRPIPVPALEPTTVDVKGTVGAIGDGTVRVDLAVSHDGVAVLAKARAQVALATTPTPS